MINTIPCNPGQLPALLRELRKLKFAVFLWGEPGVGKSESIWAFAKSERMLLEDVRLTQMDAPDLQGLKWVDEKLGITKSFRPEFFPIVDEPGIIFLDELTAAEPRMQASAYQLVLDRRIGPHILPASWMVVAAGNAPDDGAISYKMGTALADRFVHIQVMADPTDWSGWALENGVHPNVLSFIRVKPDFLTGVAGQPKGANLIAPSPRSWVRVSKIEFEVKDNTSKSLLINGIVGESAAVEYKHTCEEIADLPSMAELLRHQSPKFAAKHIPDKISCLYGLAYSMAAHVKTTDEISRAMLIFDALQDKKTNQPIAEIETLANEMILSKAVKLGIINEVVRTEGYKVYSPRARELTRN